MTTRTPSGDARMRNPATRVPLDQKSTIDTIRRRFDVDVERFSDLDAGQASTIDAPLAMDLITHAALATTPHPKHVLDIGCGAGNNTIRLGERFPGFDSVLLDISEPMLERARARVAAVLSGSVTTICHDFRTAPLEKEAFDIVLAAAVFHHLRDDSDWEQAFGMLFRIVAPGGCVWISDLVSHEIVGVDAVMWSRYGDYLESMGGSEYREKVFAYIAEEDSPRSLSYQLELLKSVGFSRVEILHKNSCFAAFGAYKSDAHE